MNKAPIFIHSLFRAGSTFLFLVFRRSSEAYWCYQEPLHELAFFARNEADLLQVDHGESKGILLRHPPIEEGYFRELRTVWPAWQDKITEPSIYANYFAPPEVDIGISYWQSLIKASKGRPVFQECRTPGRIGAIKRDLGGIHIYLWRNPWDQWWSYKVTPYFDAANQLIIRALHAPGPVGRLRKALGMEDEAPSGLAEAFGHFGSTPLSSEDSYLIFYMLWCLGLQEGLQHADVMLNIDRLSDFPVYRDEMGGKLMAAGITGIDFSDCHVPQARYQEQDRAFFEPLESRVHHWLLEGGWAPEQLEQIQAQRQQFTPEIWNSPIESCPPTDLAEQASRARALTQRFETNWANTAHKASSEGIRAQAHEERAVAAESRAGEQESRAVVAEARAQAQEERAVAAESRAGEQESRALAQEERAVAAESRAGEQESRAVVAEARAQAQEERAVAAESRAGEQESRALAQEERAVAAESRAGEQESRAVVAEARAQAQEERAVAAESRAGEQESRAVVAEARAQAQEERAVAAESRAGEQESRALVAEARAQAQEERAVAGEARAVKQESRALVAEAQAQAQEERAVAAETWGHNEQQRALAAEARPQTLESQLHQAHQDLAATNTQLQTITHQAHDWHDQILLLQRSMSWRITAPLRFVRKLIVAMLRGIKLLFKFIFLTVAVLLCLPFLPLLLIAIPYVLARPALRNRLGQRIKQYPKLRYTLRLTAYKVGLIPHDPRWEGLRPCTQQICEPVTKAHVAPILAVGPTSEHAMEFPAENNAASIHEAPDLSHLTSHARRIYYELVDAYSGKRQG